MSERKFLTIIEVDGDEASDLDGILGAITAKDPTFAYGFRHRGSGITLIVYSRYQSQAKMRGEWLTNKVEHLKGHTFRVTLDETKMHSKESLSLQEYEKRRDTNS